MERKAEPKLRTFKPERVATRKSWTKSPSFNVLGSNPLGVCPGRRKFDMPAHPPRDSIRSLFQNVKRKFVDPRP